MRLIINKALNNTNDVVNLKIIELDSADLLDNTVDYFSYKYQIPLIKFTDTGEVFNIRNFKNRLDLSLTETELILDESDLELISSGGGGGSQDLQSVLLNGNTSTENIELMDGASIFSHGFGGDNDKYYWALGTSEDGGNIAFININGNLSAIMPNPANTSLTGNTFYLPFGEGGIKTLATLDDIQAPLPIYADNASAITGGLLVDNWYKTATGELRVVV